MKLRSTFLAVALALSVGFSSQAYAAGMLDFGMIAPTTGTISFAGGANPLNGVNIEVDNVTGLGTPANAGVPGQRLCLGCVLNFTTGNFTGATAGPPPAWNFGPGGTITVTGGVDLNGNMIQDAGDIAAGTTLLSGTFIGSTTVSAFAGGFRVLGAAFVDVKDATLAAFYGLTGGPSVPWQGGFNLSFNSGAVPPNSFSSSSLLSGDIVNQQVDLPSSLLLLGSGLIGFAYLTARTRRS
jgi:hypothetical protein